MHRKTTHRAKRPTQWVVSPTGYNNATAVAAGTTAFFALANSQATSAEVVPLLERFTVINVRGHVNVQNAGVVVGEYSMGIMVRGIGATSQSADPSLAAEGQDSWLWLRHGYLTSNTQQGSPIENVEVNVRVKRILHPNTALTLFVTASAAVGLTFSPWLRTLVSRVA